MRQINSFEELSPLLSAQLRRGVVTNAFLSEAEWRSAIDGGLLVSETSASLLLFRQRTDFSQLYFYLHPPFERLELSGAGTVVTEFAVRPRDVGKEQAVLDALTAAGLAPILRRVRLTREKALQLNSSNVPVRFAQSQDIDAAMDIFKYCFDPYTGCLPSEAELAGDIDDGQLFVADFADKPAALLHFSNFRNGSEILHLATLPDCRGRGLAGALIAALLSSQNLSACRVWTGEDNETAQNLYYKFDYQLDGWRSIVLRGDLL